MVCTAWFLIFWIVGALFTSSIVSAHDGERPAIKLKDIVRPDYDAFQAPQNRGRPTDVSIQIEFLNIRNVDVGEMSLVVDIFLYMSWRDTRLQYPAERRRVPKVSLHPEWRKQLWTPDVYFYNAIEGKVLDTVIPYVYLWLKNDSTVVYGARLSLQLSCDMLLHHFPHDTQTCDIVLKSLTRTLSEMNLHWKERDSISVGDFIVLPQFELQPPVPSECQEQHLMGKHGKFACLRGVMQLSRRSGYYFINIYIPTVLIVFMSMLTFWIPVDAVPGRVTLGVTSLLTIITKQYQAALPSVSYIVALNVWLSACIGFVFGSLLEYAAVVALLNHQKRSVLESSKDLSKKQVTCQTCWDCWGEAFYAKLEKVDVVQIDRCCRICFPAVFCLHCIIYWSLYVT